jgi:hypothetical protein
MAPRKSQKPDRGASRRRGRKGAAPSVARAGAQKPATRRSRAKGSAHPKSSFDRYMELARAAAAAGDAVQSENYYQHADHYFRLMREETA